MKEKQPTSREFYSFYNKALRLGILKRKPCEVCGETKRINGHHDDYTQPLKVKWLCPEHHGKIHRGRKIKNPYKKEAAAVMINENLMRRFKIKVFGQGKLLNEVTNSLIINYLKTKNEQSEK